MDEHMAYFPIFIQLEEEDCLVAGGGRVAQRKVEILLEYGPKIRLVAPRVTDSLWKLGQQGKIQIFLRRFRPEDLEGARLVIAASNDPEVNGSISAACRQQNIPVNVVDVKEEKGIITAVLEKGAGVCPVVKEGAGNNKTLIVFSDDLDKALASFVIANGAASTGRKVTMFFTFWGLNVIRKERTDVVKKDTMSKMLG